MTTGSRIIKAEVKTVSVEEIDRKRQLLQKEQVALVAILDQLQPFDEGSRYKILKTVCEFFGMRLVD